MDRSFSNTRVNLVDLLARRTSMLARFTEASSDIRQFQSPVMGLFGIHLLFPALDVKLEFYSTTR